MTASIPRALRGPVARFGAVVVLTAMAASAGVAMAQAGPDASRPVAAGMGMGPGGHWGRGGHGPDGGTMGLEGRGLERMLDWVKASDAQRAQIRQIAEAARTDLRNQRQGATGLRDRAINALAQPTLDAREWEAVRQARLSQQAAASQRMSRAMFDIANVLTPDQRAQWAARLKERAARWEQRHGDRAAPRS